MYCSRSDVAESVKIRSKSCLFMKKFEFLVRIIIKLTYGPSCSNYSVVNENISQESLKCTQNAQYSVKASHLCCGKEMDVVFCI